MPFTVRRRFAPIVLATAALTLAVTACSAENTDSGGEQSSPSPSVETEPSVDAPAEEPTNAPTESDEGSGGSGGSAGSGGICATKDLSFTVAEKAQAGGYLLITATAKPGVSCTLEGLTIDAGFGSSLSGDVGPNEQAASDSITMTGSTKAYAGVNPKSGKDDGGLEFEAIIVSAREGDPDPVSLKLPSTAVVDVPVGTNWHADVTEAVPFVD